MYEIEFYRGESLEVTHNHTLTFKCQLPIMKILKNKKKQYVCKYFDREFFLIKTKAFMMEVDCREFISTLHKRGSLIDIPLMKIISNMEKKEYREVLLGTYSSGLEFQEQNTDIDPYFIGLWLGDGTSSLPDITSIDDEIVDYLHVIAEKYDTHITSNRKDVTYKFVGNSKKQNQITNILRKYNLINNKHIPSQYKINSRNNRLKLLAGLIDTDGYYDKKGKAFEISQKNTVLADDICFLARSLGFYVTITPELKRATNSTSKYYGIYRILIYGNRLEEIPTLLKRKKAKVRLQIKDPLSTGIKNIKYLGIKPYTGFMVDKNHRFLLGNLMITHNSYLAVNIIKKIANQKGINIGLTSTTGVSALSIGGGTIHRWAGIKLGKEPFLTIVTKIRNNRDCYKRWNECKILIIDEVSMLGKKTFELLDRVGRSIREVDLPFGGLQLIFSGDFLQLPPVQDDFVFESEIWDEIDFKCFRLKKPKRYPDLDHFHMLQRIRLGKPTTDDIKALKKRCDAYIDYIGSGRERKDEIKPTRIFSLKKDVEKHNLDELAKLPGEPIGYNSIDKFIVKKGKNNQPEMKESDDDKKKKGSMSAKDILDYTEFLDSIIPKRVFVKPGAQVMLTYNLSVELGLVNGSRGVVKSCEQEGVNVLFKNGITTKIVYNMWEFEDGPIKMVRYQLPLILAWAISVHKCVTEGTLISTENGLIRIEDISRYLISRSLPILHLSDTSLDLNLKVYGINGLTIATQIYKGNVEETLKIITSTGYYIEGSLRHPLLVYRDGKETWVKLPDIKLDDYIIMNCNTQSYNKNMITTEEFIKPKIYCKNYTIPEKINDNLCYLLGLLVGDGSYNDKIDYRIDYVSNDLELIENFCKIFNKNFDSRSSFYTEKNIYRFYNHSIVIREFLNYFGLKYSKGSDKIIPWSVLQNTKECQISFIQGLFDTDGGINKSCVHFTNISECVIDNLQVMLLNFGILSSKVKLTNNSDKNHHQAYRIQMCGESASLFLKNIGFRLERKQKQLIEQYSDHKNTPRGTNHCFPKDISESIFVDLHNSITFKKRDDIDFYSFINRGKLNQKQLYFCQSKYIENKCIEHKMKIPEKLSWIMSKNFVFDKVTEIVKSKKQLYDLFVPDGNSFVANGIFNHNCQGATLDYAILDLGTSIFAAGMGYVGLSRVKTLEGLLLSSFIGSKLYANEKALDFEETMEALESVDEENIKHKNILDEADIEVIEVEYETDDEGEPGEGEK